MTERDSAYPGMSSTPSGQISACPFPAARNGPTHGGNAKRRTTPGLPGTHLLVLDGTSCTEMNRHMMCTGRSCGEENFGDTMRLLKTISERDTNCRARLTDCYPAVKSYILEGNSRRCTTYHVAF